MKVNLFVSSFLTTSKHFILYYIQFAKSQKINFTFMWKIYSSIGVRFPGTLLIPWKRQRRITHKKIKWTLVVVTPFRVRTLILRNVVTRILLCECGYQTYQHVCTYINTPLCKFCFSSVSYLTYLIFLSLTVVIGCLTFPQRVCFAIWILNFISFETWKKKYIYASNLLTVLNISITVRDAMRRREIHPTKYKHTKKILHLLGWWHSHYISVKMKLFHMMAKMSCSQ